MDSHDILPFFFCKMKASVLKCWWRATGLCWFFHWLYGRFCCLPSRLVHMYFPTGILQRSHLMTPSRGFFREFLLLRRVGGNGNAVSDCDCVWLSQWLPAKLNSFLRVVRHFLLHQSLNLFGLLFFSHQCFFKTLLMLLRQPVKFFGVSFFPKDGIGLERWLQRTGQEMCSSYLLAQLWSGSFRTQRYTVYLFVALKFETFLTPLFFSRRAGKWPTISSGSSSACTVAAQTSAEWKQ